jgi:NADP-dependent 3-hydroxy acid dehydrogenase YdfG
MRRTSHHPHAPFPRSPISLLLFFRLNAINDILHLPIVDDLTWHLYHVLRLLLCPLGAVGLLLSFLVKLCTGAFITRFEAPEGRAILVTGCDSGFGHEFSLALVRKGWKVYAGCLTPQGMAALQTKTAGSAGTMVAVPMDVTKQADIDRVVKKINDECPKKLFAVVNNAGVGRGGLVDWTSLDEYRKTLEVNLFAMIAVCKACLPLLKESKGRIVNVTSIAGIFYGAPCMSAYAASKHGTSETDTKINDAAVAALLSLSPLTF